MKLLALLALVPSIAAADSLSARDDDGRITSIDQGVFEIDLGGLAVLTSDRDENQSVTRVSTDMSATLQYYVLDNVSVGGALLVDYENNGGGESATTFGGAVQAAVHLRLGHGAFFRPGLGLGALFGTRRVPIDATTLEVASQAGVVARLQLPIAYFATGRLLLQAGPQLNFGIGTITPKTGMSTSFTRTAGGFAVGIGYAF